MKITETNHQFKPGLKPRTATKCIVLHHAASAGDVSAATIHKWHMEGNGWVGIGYHYLVKYDGTIERGRPENTVGAHAGPTANGDSIGICLAGHLTKHSPTEAQIAALVWLIKDIFTRYGELQIIGHEEVMSTDCPGKKFPWSRVSAMLKGGTGTQQEVKLTINGRPTQVPLRVVEGRTQALLDGTWVQLRTLTDLLQAEIGWDEATRTVDFKINGR